jgi:hypothetical protein
MTNVFYITQGYSDVEIQHSGYTVRELEYLLEGNNTSYTSARIHRAQD